MKCLKFFWAIFFIVIFGVKGENYSIKWVKTLNIGGGDAVEGITYDTTGYVYITGYSYFNSSNSIVTVKYDTLGNIIKIDTLDVGIDYAYGISSDKNGNYFIAGYTKIGSTYDFLVAKYSADDNLLWTRTFDNGGNDYAFAVKNDQNGNVYIGGHSSFGSSSNNGAFIIEYDPSGNVVWCDTVFYLGSNEYIGGVAIDSHNNLYFAGKTTPPNSECLWVLKYDSLKHITWQDTIDNGYDDRGEAISVDQNGDLFVAGYVYNGTDNDIITVKYDTLGNVLWRDIIDNGGNDYAFAVKNDQNGYAYVGAYSTINGNYDYLLVKYSPSGTIVWSDTFDNGGDDYLKGVALDPHGNIYVTGNSYNGSNYDFTTIMYENQQGIVAKKQTSIQNNIRILHKGGGIITVTFFIKEMSPYSLSIYKLDGSKMYETNGIGKGEMEKTILGIPIGAYLLRFVDNGTVKKRKFTVLR